MDDDNYVRKIRQYICDHNMVCHMLNIEGWCTAKGPHLHREGTKKFEDGFICDAISLALSIETKCKCIELD